MKSADLPVAVRDVGVQPQVQESQQHPDHLCRVTFGFPLGHEGPEPALDVGVLLDMLSQTRIADIPHQLLLGKEVLHGAIGDGSQQRPQPIMRFARPGSSLEPGRLLEQAQVLGIDLGDSEGHLWGPGEHWAILASRMRDRRHPVWVQGVRTPNDPPRGRKVGASSISASTSLRHPFLEETAMSQSLPIARLRLVKVEVRCQPPTSVPGGRGPSERPEPTFEPHLYAAQRPASLPSQDAASGSPVRPPASDSNVGRGERWWEHSLPQRETTLRHGLP